MLRLLFHLGHWHGLAKLRLHSDEMLNVLDQLTTTLGNDLRAFKKKTAALKTRELQREANARSRRQTAYTTTTAEKAKTTPAPHHTSSTLTTTATGTTVKSATLTATAGQQSSAKPATRRPLEFNMNTYKTHALGDYVETIRHYGTTDSYSTEFVSRQ